MPVTVKKNNGLCSIVIDGGMNIYTISDIKKEMFESFHDCQSLELDLTGVTEMDTAGFQLLLLAKREAHLADKGFGMTGISEAASAVIGIYNMTAIFNRQQ